MTDHLSQTPLKFVSLKFDYEIVSSFYSEKKRIVVIHFAIDQSLPVSVPIKDAIALIISGVIHQMIEIVIADFENAGGSSPWFSLASIQRDITKYELNNLIPDTQLFSAQLNFDLPYKPDVERPLLVLRFHIRVCNP